MSADSPLGASKELAQQFERQGIRCTEADAPPQLWCMFCTAYRSRKNDILTDNKRGKETERSASAQGVCYEEEKLASTSGPRGSSTASRALVRVRATKDAVLDHCASRLHLHLYEHHTQEGLRQWCPVELHGYRMLLDHHCVYPARMFGNGRLLMDVTIAGGMLLGQDVCGGVKLWPQHRYSAAELVLPSSRSGVREVWVPPPSQPQEVADGDRPLALKRPRAEGRYVQLLHEGSEMPAGVGGGYSDNEVSNDAQAPWSFRKIHPGTLQFVPRYFDEDHGMRSRQVMEGTLAMVLDTTNASIIGEARLREQRRRYAATHNVSQSGGRRESQTREGRSFEENA